MKNPPIKTRMMKWHEQYHVGDVVEARFYFAQGTSWEEALIINKQTGNLIVRHLKSGTCVSVNTARDVRKPEHPWARNLEANVY